MDLVCNKTAFNHHIVLPFFADLPISVSLDFIRYLLCFVFEIRMLLHLLSALPSFVGNYVCVGEPVLVNC